MAKKKASKKKTSKRKYTKKIKGTTKQRLQKFHFPDYGITVEATSITEAEEKLKQLL